MQMYGLSDPIDSLEVAYILHKFTTLDDKTGAVSRKVLPLAFLGRALIQLQLINLICRYQNICSFCHFRLTCLSLSVVPKGRSPHKPSAERCDSLRHGDVVVS